MWDLEFWILDLRFEISGLEFCSLGFGIWGFGILGFRIWDFGLGYMRFGFLEFMIYNLGLEFGIWDFWFSSSLLFQFSPIFFLLRTEDGNMNLSPAALKFVIFQKDKRSHEIYGSYFTYTPIINMRCFCSAVTKGNRRKSLLIHG